MIAFDKATGKEAWASEANSPSGHTGGPVPITVEGVPCVAVHHFDGLLVARLDPPQAGKTVAEFPWRTEFANNIATVAVDQNRVVMTSAYNHYKMARLDVSLDGAAKVWEVPLPSKICSPVIKNGHVYWAWRQLYCIDFDSGELRWKGGRFSDAGSLIATADDRLIAWVGSGDLLLVDGFERSGREFSLLAAQRGIGQSDAWPHVVLSDGHLYCKDRSGQLVCFELAPSAP